MLRRLRWCPRSVGCGERAEMRVLVGMSGGVDSSVAAVVVEPMMGAAG
ncbi:MAG: hypothetical protein VW964_03135, partial [Ilumatobacter sp.]